MCVIASTFPLKTLINLSWRTSYIHTVGKRTMSGGSRWCQWVPGGARWFQNRWFKEYYVNDAIALMLMHPLDTPLISQINRAKCSVSGFFDN